MPRRSLTLRFEKEKDMAAVTYDVGHAPAAGKAETAAPRKNWFARFMDSLIEARMAQARREIALHVELLPYSLDERGNRLVKAGSHDMPFGGW
jgi:hypothetical protein